MASFEWITDYLMAGRDRRCLEEIKVVGGSDDLVFALSNSTVTSASHNEQPLVIDAAITQLNEAPMAVSSLNGILLPNDIFQAQIRDMQGQRQVTAMWTNPDDEMATSTDLVCHATLVAFKESGPRFFAARFNLTFEAPTTFLPNGCLSQQTFLCRVQRDPRDGDKRRLPIAACLQPTVMYRGIGIFYQVYRDHSVVFAESFDGIVPGCGNYPFRYCSINNTIVKDKTRVHDWYGRRIHFVACINQPKAPFEEKHFYPYKVIQAELIPGDRTSIFANRGVLGRSYNKETDYGPDDREDNHYGPDDRDDSHDWSRADDWDGERKSDDRKEEDGDLHDWDGLGKALEESLKSKHHKADNYNVVCHEEHTPDSIHSPVPNRSPIMERRTDDAQAESGVVHMEEDLLIDLS